MPLRHLIPADANRALGMLQAGMRQVDVAQQLGTSQSVISRLWRRFTDTGSTARRRGQGRRRSTTRRQDRYLELTVRRNPTISATQLRQQLQDAAGALVSVRTVRNRLYGFGLRARRPFRGVSLTQRHRRQRQQWARQRRNWDVEWNSVLFSDESRFGLHSDSRRIRVWRNNRTARHRSYVQEIYPFRGGTVMVWAGIALGRRTRLYVCENNMTGVVYARDIIQNIVAPIRQDVGENFMFLDDNAPPHRTLEVRRALQNLEIEHVMLPAHSPDLNPIEHAWDMLQRALNDHNPPPQTRNDLRRILPQLWENLPQDQLDNLILSMPRRVAEVLEVHGSHTHY